MPDDTEVLTNAAAADRLRTILAQLVQDEPPLGPLLVPTPEEHLLLPLEEEP